MTLPTESPEIRSSAWSWPAEWAVDEKFWREVATRTVAGVLALAFLGAPSLIYGLSTGVLTTEQVAPILIGVGIVVGIIVIYVTVLLVIRGAAKRAIVRELRRVTTASVTFPPPPPITFAFAREVLEADSATRRVLLLKFSEETQRHVFEEVRGAAIRSALAGGVAIVAGLISILAPLFK